MTYSKRLYSLYFAWLIACVCLVATLFASELFKMEVCHLCWYQRVCIYPLAVILGIACFTSDFKVIKYALPLTILGFLFGLYQYLEQMIPGFAPINLCSAQGPSCNIIHFQWLGFITFPFLSMVATLLMAILLCISRPKAV